MKHYTFYILQCADGSYYVGITNDIDTRIVQHNDGLNQKAYTYSRRPVKIAFQEHFHDVNQALAFEKQVKGWRREKKIALINREWEKLPDLSVAYRDRLMSSSRASD